MAPTIAIALPFFLVFRTIGLIDSQIGLVIAYTTFNLPLVIWVMRSFFLEMPQDIEEAALVDGASRWRAFLLILPLAGPAVVATGLLTFIAAWNEFFFAVSLTAVQAQTMPVFLVGFIAGQGLYWAKLCAAATMAALPVVLAGWVAQNKLVRGLSFGAIK